MYNWCIDTKGVWRIWIRKNLVWGGGHLNKITCNISLVITIIGLLILVTGTSYAALRGNTSSSNEQIIRAGDVTCTDTISGTDGAKSESCKINNVECTDETCNNKYYTHPAFTFGEEELEEFWIGKFELTGTIYNITTKPNLSSLRNQNVSTFETNIMAMNDEGNIYGLSTNNDTYMIKNMQWGI